MGGLTAATGRKSNWIQVCAPDPHDDGVVQEERLTK